MMQLTFTKFNWQDSTTVIQPQTDSKADNQQNSNTVDGIRWWRIEDGPELEGLCGKSAPILPNGFYAVCNPSNESSYCCSPYGHCGSGPAYCDCPNCLDYKKNPELLTKAPLKPTVPVSWYFNNAEPEKSMNDPNF